MRRSSCWRRLLREPAAAFEGMLRHRGAQAGGVSRIGTHGRRQRMGKVVVDMSLSLDGIGAGPNPRAEEPMGTGGERLHAWHPFHDPEHELTAGLAATEKADARLVRDLFAATGAVVLGKRTCDLGLEPWGGTPFPVPCFVLTHEARDDLETATG